MLEDSTNYVTISPTITATQINYYFICFRKLWFFSHQINMEQNIELVALGKLLHENSYQRENKEIQIGPIKIDFIGKDRIVHEIKKILEKINQIINSEEIPPVINKTRCKKCSYYELCYI